MSHRIPNSAPIGSLFKTPREKKRRPELGKPVRQLDPAHLALVRQCPCLVCGSLPSEAAHVRTPSAAHGKRACGMGVKPDDRWTLPLCHQHHMEQHQEGELTFYFRLNVSPVQLSQDLYRVSPDLDSMRRVVMDART